MCSVNMYEAKTNLSKYVDMLVKGEVNEIELCNRGKVVAVITLPKEKKEKKRLGAAIGKIPEFEFDLKNEAMCDEIAREFGL